MKHIFSFSFCHSFFLPFVSCFDADPGTCDRYLLKVVISAVNGRAAASQLLVVVWMFDGGSSDSGCKHRQVTGGLCF